jgi:hypothetical protein
MGGAGPPEWRAVLVARRAFVTKAAATQWANELRGEIECGLFEHGETGLTEAHARQWSLLSDGPMVSSPSRLDPALDDRALCDNCFERTRSVVRL